MSDNVLTSSKDDALEAKELPLIVLDGSNQPYCQLIKSVDENGHKNIKAYLQGEILDVDEYVELIDALFSADSEDKIYIYIDSPGGHISAGSIISSAIDACKGEVYTVARGLCASAACLIHNAAKPGHAIVDDMGVLMIHFSSHMDMGNSRLIEKRAADQSKYVITTLLSQAVEMGYLSNDELSAIQTGAEIFISKQDFEKRIELKAKGSLPTDNLIDESVNNPIPDDELSKVPEENISGTEDFRLTTDPQMVTINPAERVRVIKANALRIRTTDKKNFRIYIPSDCVFSRSFIINLCMFLDTRKEDETVTFVLGAKLDDGCANLVGAIISAINSCKAKIITIAAGYCSIAETMIWCFGDVRLVLRYGALTFGITELVRQVPKYLDYFKAFLSKAREIEVLTDEDVDDITKKNLTKFFVYGDLKH